MRKSSKVVSLVLSGLMATSCFTMAVASAAEVDSESTGAFVTAAERIAAGHQVVFFQFPTSAWGPNSEVKYNTRKHTCNVFCNYYALYGNETEVKESAWEAPSTSMYKDDKDSSIYFYDITEAGKGELEDGAQYGILFSTQANAGSTGLIEPNKDGFQTSDLYFDKTCLGTTYHIVEPAVKGTTTRENTANSQKIDYIATNDGVGKSIKKVSSLCSYIDGADPGNAPKSLELANRLQAYLPNPVNEPSFVWAKIEPLLSKFGTTAQDVYDMYVEKYKEKHDSGEHYVPCGDGSDLKEDGSLKDVFRYTVVVTTEEEGDVVKEKKTKYPDLDLVRERLNLPKEEPTTAAPETTVPETTAAPETTVPETTAPPEDTFVVAGSEAEIFGTAWDSANTDNLMSKADDGTYTKDYTVSKAYDVVQLKVVKNGSEWIGDKTDNNVTFTLTGEGTFTVVYDPVENYAYAKGDIVKDVEFSYEKVYAAGNGEGTWLNGVAWEPDNEKNLMTEVAKDVWEISFENVPDGFERQIKFTLDGKWTHNFGGLFAESGAVSDAVYNGDNITFDTDDTCTVKAQLDLRDFDFVTKEGAKFTLTVEYGEPAGIYGDVNGDGVVTIDDATLVQRRGVELEKFTELQDKLADVNGDGRVSILDVTCIQKYLAQWTEGIGKTGKPYYE